ncbi:uncharacterized protein GIQ15_06214 [Arthroderma uncinatum]|uniref:uncharacterized protein n=1 Tax=Arthroderma uncinatum TaxID=74035 RepID=UPI00144A7CCE|nr:uncharacterized protein GIQ15_06214 [Arthroderma uncinatum]KAF3480867.1 hypothetical protein GIQ15_06214 [Arthroderma uncinatum]
MPVVEQIVPQRSKKYWSSLDHHNEDATLEAVMQEFNKYDEEAFHYYNRDPNPGHPPSVYWIVKPYFLDCQVFLLHGSFRLLGEDKPVTEAGRSYLLKDEERIGLCGSTTVVVIEEGEPGEALLPSMVEGGRFDDEKNMKMPQCLVS